MTTTAVRETHLPFPSEDDVDVRLDLINQLKYFLATAPTNWDVKGPHDEEPFKRHRLPTGEFVSCVQWKESYYISGTDIVRSLIFRFHAFGRPVKNLKKFEEGIFSDLRNLKPGSDATLEEPKSSFLDLLYKHNCIRTQKKQKVFSWFSVPHDRLFLDALERDLKREKLGMEPTSVAVANPAVSISLDTTQAMFDEFRKNLLSDLELDACLNNSHLSNTSSNSSDTHTYDSSRSSSYEPQSAPGSPSLPRPLSGSFSAPLLSSAQDKMLSTAAAASRRPVTRDNAASRKATTVFGHFSLFEGSPSYKQRRRRTICNPATMGPGFRQHCAPNTAAVNDPRTMAMRSLWWPYDRTTSARSEVGDDTVRLYTCPLNSCAKVFKRLEHLKRHLRTHTMERPYLCGLCGKRFSRSDNLAQHKKTHERRQRPLTSDSSSDNSDNNDGDNNTRGTRAGTHSMARSTNTSNASNGNTSHGATGHDGAGHANQGYYYSQDASTSYGQWSQSMEVNTKTMGYSDDGEDDLAGVFPSLSASTSSSSASSCNSSPTCAPKPMVTLKLESDLFEPPVPLLDTFMEELLPQPHESSAQDHVQDWSHETANHWDLKIDWDQYSSASCFSPTHPDDFHPSPHHHHQHSQQQQQQQQPRRDQHMSDMNGYYMPYPTHDTLGDFFPSSASSPVAGFASQTSLDCFGSDHSPTMKPLNMINTHGLYSYPAGSPTMRPTDALIRF